MNKFTMYSNSVSIASSKSKNYFDADFIIGSFEPNGNKDKVNRDTIEKWLPTLLHTHLVGNIRKNSYGNYDFGDHEVREIISIDEFGQEHQDFILDTSGFGTCIGTEIREIDNKEYIVATFRIFKRYPQAAELVEKRISNGTLYSSWEVNINSFHYEDDIRVIDDGEFLSHCVLGSNIMPACKDAKLLNVASKQDNIEKILLEEMERNGDLVKKDKTSIVTEEAVVVENATVENQETVTETVVESTKETIKENNSDDKVTASLTNSDLYRELQKSIREKIKEYPYIAYYFPIEQIAYIKRDNNEQKDLEFEKVSYVVENDKINITKIEKIELVAKPSDINSLATELNIKLELANKATDVATASLKELQDKVVELEVYKSQVEEIQAKQALAAKEEKQKVLSNKLMSLCNLTSEDIENNEILKNAIASLDETTINGFIVDNMLSKSEIVSTASQETSVASKLDLGSVEEEYNFNGSVAKSIFGK